MIPAARSSVDIPRKAPNRVGFSVAAVSLAAVTLFAVLAAVWRSPAVAAPVVARSTVWTARVRRGDLVRQVPVQGTLVPDHVDWLSAGIAARVARINVRPGAEVDAETVLVVLENSELELAALEAERQAASAESAGVQLDVMIGAEKAAHDVSLYVLRSDSRDAARHARTADRLAAEGLLSGSEQEDNVAKSTGLLDRVTQEEARIPVLAQGRARRLGAQRSEVARLREIAAFRRRQLAALQVRAGSHGMVQEIPLESGQWVAIGTVLAKVAEPNRLKAEVTVAEANAKDVGKGLRVRFETASKAVNGHIERVDPAVVAGHVRVSVILDDASPMGARADQTVTGYAEIEKLYNVLSIPRPAGANDGTKVALFRLDADRIHATRLTARLGRGSAREIEVAEGLAEGDEVVVSDMSAFDTSGRIKLK